MDINSLHYEFRLEMNLFTTTDEGFVNLTEDVLAPGLQQGDSFFWRSNTFGTAAEGEKKKASIWRPNSSVA